jgi:hypothetical protein
MRFQVILIRFGIVLIVLTFGFAVFFRGQPVHQRDDSWIYDAIELEKSGYHLHDWFRERGWQVDVPDWPKTVGEIEGYETGFIIHYGDTESGKPINLSFPPTNSVHWTVHRVNSSHSWVAYGVTYYGSSMRFVVAKRSGKETQTPDEIKRILR